MENYTQRNNILEFKIQIDNQVYQKIMHWVDKAPGEVSGLGKLTLDRTTGLIEIKSAILLKQENTGTSTEIDADAVCKAMFELKDEPGELNFWWHSHVNMGVFWSGTDKDTIKEIGSNGFVVATVFNKKREMKSCFYKKINDDMFPEMFVDDIETRVVDYIPATTIDEWDAEYNTKCSSKYPKYPDYSRYNNRSWGYNNETLEDLPNDEIVNDDIKIYAALPEINVLLDKMKSQTEYSKAKHYLHQICAVINRLKLNDSVKSYNAKKPYLDIFDEMFPLGWNNNGHTA